MDALVAKFIAAPLESSVNVVAASASMSPARATRVAVTETVSAASAEIVPVKLENRAASTLRDAAEFASIVVETTCAAGAPPAGSK